MKDGVPPDPEQAARFPHMLSDVTGKADKNSRLKQIVRTEKKASSTQGNIVTRRNTVCSSSSGSRFISATSTTRPLTKISSISSAPSSAPLLGNTIELLQLSFQRQCHLSSGRDTDPDRSTFTGSLYRFAPDKTLSMPMDDIVSPPKHVVGRTSSMASVFLQVLPQIPGLRLPRNCTSHLQRRSSVNVCAPFYSTPNNLRGPPPLGMRGEHNLPNSSIRLKRHATTQSLYASSQAKGQKQVTLQRLKLPLLGKPNPKLIPIPRQVVQTPESPLTSTPELDKDDSNDDGDECSLAHLISRSMTMKQANS